jgi:hypothetical protein
MSAEQRDQLIDLHREAVTAWAKAVQDGKIWPIAYAADDRFINAMNMIEVTA